MAGRTKAEPVHTGCDAYFPYARRAVSRVSVAGNAKHNPGEPLHWAVEKSTQHPDSAAGHMIDPYEIEPESGEMHIALAAWRVMAWANTVYEAIELGICTREDLLHGRVRVEQLGQLILDARNARAVIDGVGPEPSPLPVRSLEAEREQVVAHSGPPDAAAPRTDRTADAMAEIWNARRERVADRDAFAAPFTGEDLDVVVVDPVSEPYYQPTTLSAEAVERWRSEELLRTGSMPTVIDADPLIEFEIRTSYDPEDYGISDKTRRPVYEAGEPFLPYHQIDLFVGEEPEEGEEVGVVSLRDWIYCDCGGCDQAYQVWEASP